MHANLITSIQFLSLWIAMKENAFMGNVLSVKFAVGLPLPVLWRTVCDGYNRIRHDLTSLLTMTSITKSHSAINIWSHDVAVSRKSSHHIGSGVGHTSCLLIITGYISNKVIISVLRHLLQDLEWHKESTV